MSRSRKASRVADFEHEVERGNRPHTTDLLEIDCLWISLGGRAADRAIQRLDSLGHLFGMLSIALSRWSHYSRHFQEIASHLSRRHESRFSGSPCSNSLQNDDSEVPAAPPRG